MKKHESIFSLCLSLALLFAGAEWAVSELQVTTVPDNQCFTLVISCVGPNGCILPPDQHCENCDSPQDVDTSCHDQNSSIAGDFSGTFESCTGSPVFLATGEYFTSATDLSVKSVGVPLLVHRNYESNRRTAGLGGLGWSSPAQARVSEMVYMFQAPNTYLQNVQVLLPNGFTRTYTSNPDGTYSSVTGRHDTLVKNLDGTWDFSLIANRRTYHFASTGELLTITDRYNNIQNWTYSAGRLDRITDVATGRFIQFSYGADGRVSAVADNTGRTVQYTYDIDGKLTTVNDPENRNTTYYYTAGRMGPLLSQIADNWNRVITTITYNPDDTVHTYTENGALYTFNADRTQKSRFGGTYHYTYLPSGPVTSRTNVLGGTETIEYNPDFTVHQRTNEVGVKTLYDYNANGLVTSVTRDSEGPLAVRFDIGYDSNFPERVISITPKDPVTGDVNHDWQAWQADYYPPGSSAPGALYHLYRVRSDGSTLDALATFTYNGNGQVTSITDGAASLTSITYDGSKDVASVTYPRNSTAGPTLEYQYGHDTLGRITSVTDPLNHTTSVTYDNLNRVKSVTLQKPSPSSPEFIWQDSYDNFDSATGLAFEKQTDFNGRMFQQGYDQYGRIVKSVDLQKNATTTFAYTNDALSSVTNAKGEVTHFRFKAGELLDAIWWTANDWEGINYNYDLRKRVASRGILYYEWVVFAYDSLDRLVQKAYGSSGQTPVDYTYVGQKLTQVADALAGETHSYTYDSSYRRNGETQGPRGQINYSYDAGDRLSEYAVVGGPTTSYQYYPDGSVQSIQWSRIPGEFDFTYRLDGRYQQIQMPNGQHRDFLFDDQGRLTEVANIHPTAGNLATYDYGYDVDYNVPPTSMLGQRTSLTSTVPSQGLSGSLTKYYFDSAYQLTETDYPNVGPFNGEVHSWTYDSIGNRLSATVNENTVPYTYQPNSELLYSVDTTLYGFNANWSLGSRTQGLVSYGFSWDARNKLSSINGGTDGDFHHYSYSYDFRGRRFSKTVDGVSSTFLYAGQNLISQTTGSATSEFLFAPGIDKPLAAYIGGTAYYYSVDGLGSVSLLTDTNGTVQDSYVYDAWGNIRTQTVNIPQPFVYTAREAGEQGLLYYRARYYDPSIGRFISRDPIRYADFSLFPYAGNDPVNFIDPSGLQQGKYFGLPKPFWNWYHRQIKEKGDPDLTKEEADEWYKTWQEAGEPDAEGHATKPPEGASKDSCEEDKDLFSVPDANTSTPDTSRCIQVGIIVGGLIGGTVGGTAGCISGAATGPGDVLICPASVMGGAAIGSSAGAAAAIWICN